MSSLAKLKVPQISSKSPSTAFTHRLLRRALVKALKAWHTGHGPLDVTHSPSIRRILQEQTLIGWENLLVGLPSKLWSSFQQDHYMKHRSRRDGVKWMRQLLPKLLQMGKRQWRTSTSFKTIVCATKVD